MTHCSKHNPHDPSCADCCNLYIGKLQAKLQHYKDAAEVTKEWEESKLAEIERLKEFIFRRAWDDLSHKLQLTAKKLFREKDNDNIPET
jgi:hypothetical protein